MWAVPRGQYWDPQGTLPPTVPWPPTKLGCPNMKVSAVMHVSKKIFQVADVCLICYDYGLCASCYGSSATTGHIEPPSAVHIDASRF